MEQMAFWLIMWGSILIIVIFSVSVGSFLQYKKSMLKVNAQLKNIEDGVVQKELENVKARLAVLEKIVTDKNYDLKEELDELHRRR